MNLKLSLLSLCAVLATGSTASAQDFLYRSNGGKEEVKVKEVGTRTIVYKKWNNQDGPDFVIPKGDVEKIEFENGDEEFFGRREERRPMRASKRRASNVHYGKNIIAAAPISMNNTSATGVGLSYERVLDKNYIVSFYLPVTFSFRSENNNYNYTGSPYGDRNANVVWINPGVKFYPSGSDHKVTYAVGVSVPLITGSEPQYGTFYDPNSQTYQNRYDNENIFMAGIMVTNYLNIQPTPKLYLGMQLGLGMPYYSAELDNTYGNSGRYFDRNSFTPLIDFSFRIGFRF